VRGRACLKRLLIEAPPASQPTVLAEMKMPLGEEAR
jgi:hypothetical protein